MSDQGDVQDKGGSGQNPEAWLPDDILAVIAGKPPVNGTKWQKVMAPGLGYWSRGGSQNHPLMAGVVWLYAQPGWALQGGMTAPEFWLAFLKAQLDGKGAEGALTFFQGSELLSNTYAAWSQTSVALAWAWALQRGNPEVAELAARYLRACAALYALGAAPTPDMTPNQGPLNRQGQVFCDGPWIPGPGGRSTMAHTGQDDRVPLFARLIGWPMKVNKRESWTGRALEWAKLDRLWTGPFESLPEALRNLVSGSAPPPAEVLDLLSSVSLIRRIEHWRWPAFSLCAMIGTRPNMNTGCIFWSTYDRAARKAVHGYPWPPRIRESAEKGECKIEPDQHQVVAQTVFDTSAGTFPAEPPLWRIAVGPQGVEAGAVTPAGPQPA